MAVLSDAERKQVAAHMMRLAGVVPGPVVVPALIAAVNYTDDWIETNQPSYVTGLPEPYKSNSTTQQKTLLFCYDLMRRAGILHVEGD